MKIKKQEEGFILVSGLILLLIITLMALYGTANSITQEKVAGGMQDAQAALQNAESALRIAENYVYANLDTTSAFTGTCTAGLCIPSTTNPVWNTIAWDTNTANTIQVPANTFAGVTQQPKYIVELLDSVPPPPGESAKTASGKGMGTAFRITVVAWGNRSGTKSTLQSVFVKR